MFVWGSVTTIPWVLNSEAESLKPNPYPHFLNPKGSLQNTMWESGFSGTTAHEHGAIWDSMLAETGQHRDYIHTHLILKSMKGTLDMLEPYQNPGTMIFVAFQALVLSMLLACGQRLFPVASHVFVLACFQHAVYQRFIGSTRILRKPSEVLKVGSYLSPHGLVTPDIQNYFSWSMAIQIVYIA